MVSEKVFIDADELLLDSYRLAAQVIRANFEPSFMIAIWRGGAPIGIAVQEFMSRHPLFAECETGANFILLTILREKWPVGSKAKFRTFADRVRADHTYLAVPCGAVQINEIDDEAILKEAETNQLAAKLGFFRVNRKRFANSSAVQGLIKRA